jgi:hypothetical protein
MMYINYVLEIEFVSFSAFKVEEDHVEVSGQEPLRLLSANRLGKKENR